MKGTQIQRTENMIETMGEFISFVSSVIGLYRDVGYCFRTQECSSFLINQEDACEGSDGLSACVIESRK